MYKIYNSNNLNNFKRSLLQNTASLGDEKLWVRAEASLPICKAGRKRCQVANARACTVYQKVRGRQEEGAGKMVTRVQAIMFAVQQPRTVSIVNTKHASNRSTGATATPRF